MKQATIPIVTLCGSLSVLKILFYSDNGQDPQGISNNIAKSEAGAYDDPGCPGVLQAQ